MHLKSRMTVEERARIVSWQIYEDTDNCKIERERLEEGRWGIMMMGP